jgi:Pro-kumamolisin, activation domain
MPDIAGLRSAAVIAAGALILGSLSWGTPARAGSRAGGSRPGSQAGGSRAGGSRAGGSRAGSRGAARVPVPGTHPSWAVPVTRLGPASMSAGPVSVRVYLASRDPAGLSRYAAAVSTPGNALYRRYLSPAQAMARFGPAPARVPAIRSWLTSAGLTVTAVRPDSPPAATSLPGARSAPPRRRSR